MHLDRVELVFTATRSKPTADSAPKQKTGARGLRTIIEEVLLDVMFEIPSRGDVKKVMIDAEPSSSASPAQLIGRSEARAWSSRMNRPDFRSCYLPHWRAGCYYQYDTQCSCHTSHSLDDT